MENKKVFIGNLDFSATEAELESLLSKFGSIASITLKQKKGCAFFEMENAEDAARAVQELNGIKHKGREMRLSFYMKARKARIVSVRNYKDRGVRFGGKNPAMPDSHEPRPKKEDFFTPNRPAPEGGKPGPARSSKASSGYAPRERTPGSDTRPARSYASERSGSSRLAKKPWSADKPSYSGRPERDGFKPVSRRPLKPESRYKPSERMPGSDTRPARSYASERSGSSRPAKKPWSGDKPSYAGKPDRDGFKPLSRRPLKPESRYKALEQGAGSNPTQARSYSSDRSGLSRPAKKPWLADKPAYPRRKDREEQRPATTRQPKKEWSLQRPTRPSGAAENRGPGPERNKRFGDTSRGPAKPRPQGAAPNRFTTTPRPGSGTGTGKRTPNSSKPKPRTHSAARSKPQRRY